MLFGLPQLTRPLRASLSLKPVLKWTLVSTLLFVGAVVGTALGRRPCLATARDRSTADATRQRRSRLRPNADLVEQDNP